MQIFNFLVIKVDVLIISGNFKVDFLIEIFTRFLLKSNWIQIPTIWSLLFQNSSDPDVLPNTTYLLLLLETWNFNTKENLWAMTNN